MRNHLPILCLLVSATLLLVLAAYICLFTVFFPEVAIRYSPSEQIVVRAAAKKPYEAMIPGDLNNECYYYFRSRIERNPDAFLVPLKRFYNESKSADQRAGVAASVRILLGGRPQSDLQEYRYFLHAMTRDESSLVRTFAE